MTTADLVLGDEVFDELLHSALGSGSGGGSMVYTVVVVEIDDAEEMRVVIGRHRHSVIQVLASVLQCEDGGPVVVRPVVYLEQEKKNPSRSNQRGYGHPRPRAEAVGRFCSWASSHPQR